MDNIKTTLISELKNAFIKKYQFDIGIQYFSVIYVGNHGIDYSMRSLFALQKYLGTINIDTTCQELFNDLTCDLNKIYYDIAFDKNFININLKTSHICNLMINAFDNYIILNITNKKNLLILT